MRIIQSTWVRYHHFNLANELNKKGFLKGIYTSLPWWYAKKESHLNNIPLELIKCNFLFQGIRRVGNKIPGYTKKMDFEFSKIETKYFSKWIAKTIPSCDAYIAISGTGLEAGRKVKNNGGIYIMDRGSTQMRYQDKILKEEYELWKMPYTPINPWLIENEEAEQFEADIITVPSDFVKKTFVKQGVDANKLRVVPYGVSIDEFYPVTKPSSEYFRIVFAGQFSVRKGAGYLLEAFKKFDHPNKELMIIGNVSDELKSLIRNIGIDKVQFLGVVKRDALRYYFSSAHVLALPSIEEGLALVQAQAMACGCPVIATPNTGSENLFTNNVEGILIKPRSISSLVQAFTYLADNEEHRSRMSIKCIEKVKKIGGWENYTNGIVTTIKDELYLRK